MGKSTPKKGENKKSSPGKDKAEHNEDNVKADSQEVKVDDGMMKSKSSSSSSPDEEGDFDIFPGGMKAVTKEGEHQAGSYSKKMKTAPSSSSTSRNEEKDAEKFVEAYIYWVRG